MCGGWRTLNQKPETRNQKSEMGRVPFWFLVSSFWFILGARYEPNDDNRTDANDELELVALPMIVC